MKTISEHFPPFYRDEILAAYSDMTSQDELAQVLDTITDRMARDGYVRERGSESRYAALQAQCARFGGVA